MKRDSRVPPSRGGANLAHRLSNGSESAAGELDRLFRERLCLLVEREMNLRYRRREDPEDVVQSVFRTFFRRAGQGQYEWNHDGALWQLLKQIARHKVLKHARYHDAQARDIAKDETMGDQLEDTPPDGVGAQIVGDALECALAGLEPPEPEVFRLQLHGYSIAEIIDTVLKGLDASYAEILQLRLQGQSMSQIARELNCTRAVIRYRLQRICQRLQKLLAYQSGFG